MCQDLRLATRNESPLLPQYGANLDWVPGSRTKSGTVEAVFKIDKNIQLQVEEWTLPLPWRG